MFRALRYGAIAIGGYLAISAGVNIVAVADESAAERRRSDLAVDGPELANAAPTTSMVILLSPPAPGGSTGDAAPPSRKPRPSRPDASAVWAIAEFNVITGGPTSAAAGWSTVDGAQYALELIGPDGGLVQVFETAATQWSMEGLAPGSAYLVRVRAVDPVTGGGGGWAEQLFATLPAVDTTAPAPPAAEAEVFVPAPQPVAGPGIPVAQYFENCAAARAAGAAPLYRGEPGYRSNLDRDDDGVACE